MLLLQEWLTSVVAQDGRSQKSCAGGSRGGRGGTNRERGGGLSGRRRKRREYARIQELWRKSMSKAAHMFLDGDMDGVDHPSLEQQVVFWLSVMEGDGEVRYDRARQETEASGECGQLWAPTAVWEMARIRVAPGSAHGPDGIGAAVWRAIPCLQKAVVFNIILMEARCPQSLIDSRTVLIPKEIGAVDPAKFRPLSIASVVLRHLHKILANRVLAYVTNDERQRGFIRADGVAENIAVLGSLLADARARGRPLFVSVLDVRKAFDSVTHEAIREAMRKKRFPKEMRRYLNFIYYIENARTPIEVDGRRGAWIHPRQGVKQGDPMSPALFNAIVDEVLGGLPRHIGYDIGDGRVNVPSLTI